MISSHVKSSGAPNVLAVFSFRYDAHLVPDMLASVGPMVDGWIAYDDRRSEDVFSHEIHRRTNLLIAAREAGARWALAIDPDERFEQRLIGEMPRLTQSGGGPLAYTFDLREMYAPDAYRVDGVWGIKLQARLLSLADGVVRPEGNLHLSWASFIPPADLVDTQLNLYHLKMITPERRRARAALYNQLDPGRSAQEIGYDYLADDEGAVLERIPPGRGYFPPHVDDGGLWMPMSPTMA